MMFNNKSVMTIISLSLLGAVLMGCASERKMGDGTVVQERKIANTNYFPQRGTLVGATTGAGVGVGTGALIGGASGAAVGTVLAASTFGISTPMIPVFVVAGAASGAMIGGAAGGVTGAGIGYTSDVIRQESGVYEFTIKPDNQSQNIVVTQYASTLPLKSRVQILLKDDHYYIERV